ncbi:MAG: hypothetical protein K2O10_04255, partial [Muribaculaceae bacterium]|nr:hypothetical protein [Muribaculaceae bacterium]
MTTLAITDSNAAAEVRGMEPRRFSMSWASARVPLMFMLSMSLVGLTFYPAILLILAFIAYSWRKG